MKTIIVGGGIGGISSALLASQRGEEVILFEAHENIGGCASWFKRGKFCFDVGATTVSGVDFNQPLGKIFKLIGKSPELTWQDPGIVFHLSNGKKLSYCCGFDAWMLELEKTFPHLTHRPFWEKVYKINSHAWELLDSVKSFPFKSIADFTEIFSRPDLFNLYPYLLVNTEMMLKIHGLHHPEYLELINGILLISAQAHAENVPFLIGAMALAYPRQTYAPQGGMRGFFDFLESACLDKGIRVKNKSRVTMIDNHKVFLNQDSHEYDQLILNVPCWNQAELFQGREKVILEKDLKEPKEAWGAFTLYFGIPSFTNELYQQVHLNHPEVSNYFISFSLPEDESRAPLGWQAVTISTHVNVETWFGVSSHDYRLKKQSIMNIIISDFKERFSIQEVKHLTAGTPKTFQDYTLRKNGYVGGLPFLYGMNPFSILSSETGLEKVFRVGDTIFPGQGLVGVAAGALALDYRIKKSTS